MIRKAENDKIETLKGGVSRAEFLKILTLSSFAYQLMGAGCVAVQKEERITSVMTNEQALILIEIQQLLLPSDGDGPSAKDVNAFAYLLWFLQDERIDKYERSYYIKGTKWVNDVALNKYGDAFLELNATQKEAVINELALNSKTKLWLSKLLTYVFEALLSDPIYGANTAKKGWEWLKHNPGEPRPQKTTFYPVILEKGQEK